MLKPMSNIGGKQKEIKQEEIYLYFPIHIYNFPIYIYKRESVSILRFKGVCEVEIVIL